MSNKDSLIGIPILIKAFVIVILLLGVVIGVALWAIPKLLGLF